MGTITGAGDSPTDILHDSKASLLFRHRDFYDISAGGDGDREELVFLIG